METHNHIYGYGSHFFPEGQPQPGKTDPSIPWTNKADGLAQIRTLALNKQPGEWIITSPASGLMGLVVELQKGEVTRFDLDKAAPNNPVVLHWSVQSEAIVNTKALEPLLERYPDIPGVRRDGNEVPTGRLAGLAIWTLHYEFFPQVPPEELGPLYKLEMEEVASREAGVRSQKSEPRPRGSGQKNRDE